MTRRRAWALVALLSCTATASYLARVNVSVAGALMRTEFGISQEGMGRIFSAFVLGYALAQIPAGMLADRLGARRVLMAAAAGWVVCTALMPLAPAGAAVAVLLGARFLLGVAEAPTFPSAAQAISIWIPPEAQGRANGFVIAAIGLGSAIAPPLVSSVMMRAGWRTALLVSVVPAVLVAIGWWLVRAPSNLPVRAGGTVSLRGLATVDFVLLTVSYTLQGYVGYIFVFWFYLYLVDVRHFDLLRSAVLSSLPWLLSIVSIPLGGWMSDRLVRSKLGPVWGRRIVPMAGLAGASVFLAAGAHTANAYTAAFCLALATAFVLSVEGPFWASMTAIAGARSGAAGGIMNMGSNIGGFISPALTPILAASVGWENALHVAAVLSVVASLLWLRISATPSDR